MHNVLKASLNDLLPVLQHCECLVLEEGDIIIHAPGFEDRTMDIAKAIAPTPKSRAILIDYIPHNSENRLADVRTALSALGVHVANEDILKYNRFDPGDFETNLQALLSGQDVHRAIIDISSMSKLLIMLVLNICNKLNLGVCVLYCEAQTYEPSQEEFERAKQENKVHRPTLQIYTGVHGVVRVDSLASVAMQGQPTAAIVFMSFNDNLTQALLNTVYPGRLFLINGRPPVHSWREEATAWIHDQVRREWEEDNPVIYSDNSHVLMPKRIASTFDYRETVSLLFNLYWQLSITHRVLLAPAGSKMQAVGCYLVKALHPDIHVEYPSPEGFAKEYSVGVGSRWLLDLGNISERLTAIASAERREYLEIPM